MLGAETFYPPHRICTRDTCPWNQNQNALTDPIPVECRLFTLQRGVLPVVSTSLYCRGTQSSHWPFHRAHRDV